MVYRDNRPLMNKEKSKPMDCKANFSVANPDVPNATLNFRLKWRGFGDVGQPVEIGYWKVRWYITFMG